MNEQKSNYLLFQTFRAKAEATQNKQSCYSEICWSWAVVCKEVVVVVVDLGLISSTGQADLLQRFKSGKEINKMKKQFLEAEHTQTRQ